MEDSTTIYAPIHIWTDGGASLITRIGAWAVYIPHYQVILGESVEDTTCNRMELVAILKAFSYAPRYSKIVIHTDSNNSIQWLTGTFQSKDQTIKNLCIDIEGVIERRELEVSYVFTKAHSDDEYNNLVDAECTRLIKIREAELQESNSITLGEY